MNKLLTNPFFIYIGSFLVVLLIYSLGWSNLYPSIQPPVIIFIGATFVVAFLLGVCLHVTGAITYHKITGSNLVVVCLIGVWISYMMEFYYNGGIPLLIIARGGVGYDYRLFGIPTFHVLLVTFN